MATGTQQTFIKLKFANPPLDGQPRTYLTSDVSATDTTTPVRSTSGFVITGAVDYYNLYGSYGEEKAEYKLVDASDAATDADSFKVAALSFSHEASDPVTRIPFNQIIVYGLTVTGGTKNEIEIIDIDASRQYTAYTYEGSTYAIFVIAYYNSNTGDFGTYSAEITPTTFTRQTCGKIIKAGLRKAMTHIDENPDGDITWDVALEVVQEGMDEIITRKRIWPFLETVDSSQSTTASVAYIEKPTNMNQLLFIKVNDFKIDWMSLKDYHRYTDGINSTGVPTNYTVRDDKYYLIPTPDSAYDVEFDYYKRPAVGLTLVSEVDIPFVPILIYFCASQFALIRGNDKRSDKMYALFAAQLERQVEEFGAPTQLGDAEYVEEDSIYGEDTSNYLI